MARNNAHKNLHKTLTHYGFKNIHIGNLDFKKGNLLYNDITLDADKFSTIATIQMLSSPIDTLLHKQPRRTIIDDAKLTAEWAQNSGLRVSGWKKKALPHSAAYQEIILNSGQLDLLTSAGALRFQTKGTLKKQPDGAMKLQAALWGIQHQLKIETLWSGLIYPDGKWQYDIEFKEGGLNLDKVQASRVSGWLNIDKTRDIIPELSGQLDAGKMIIGDLGFTNMSLTLSGAFNLYQLIIKAQISGFKDMTALLDINNTAKGQLVTASIETASLDDLLAFLSALQNSDIDTGSFTSLLLTKGNLDRIRKDVNYFSYDTLEFQVNGPLYDLVGKIIVKKFKNGAIQRNIISLDPGR